MLAALAVFSLANGIILSPVANMYSKPDPGADVVSQAIYGTALGILEEQSGWARVRTPDDYTGWVRESVFRKLREGEQPYAAGGRAAMVENLFANVYREPDVTKHAPVLTLPFETRVQLADGSQEDARWLRIVLVAGDPAWIQRGDVTLDPAPISIDAAIALSKRFLGLPYLWGGTSTFGYDCSGFMQMLYRRMGVTLPRDAQPQADWSGLVPVKRGELRPGDLLYFGATDKKITHTGMYIGSGEFINATTHEHPVVRIEKLDDPPWTTLLVGARRLK